MPRYGTLSILDTLATYNNSSVTQFGEENMAGYLNRILDAYNEFTTDILGDLVGNPPDRETVYGVNLTQGDMIEVDEFGLADAQKIPFSPSSVAFPLRRYQYTLQWTRDFLENSTPLEMANQVLGAAEADERNFFTQLRRALFRATNTTVLDRTVDNRSLTVRALVNADSQTIPPQPISGATFNAGSHTHYLGTGSFVEANLTALVETVREHGLNGGRLVVYINSAQEATVRAFSGFYPYTDARLVYSVNATRAAEQTDQNITEDRAIGIHGPAEVWVKPWMPASYVLAAVVGGSNDPVIGWRRPAGGYARYAGLAIAAELDRFPLHAQALQRMFGFGVWNRTGAAALYTANATYASYTG